MEARHLVDALPECDETEDFVRRHVLVFVIVASVLCFINAVFIAKRCWDCCCRGKKADDDRHSGSSLKLVDIMSADLLPEDILNEVGWFYGDEGNTRGPFVDSEIFQLLDEGELCKTSRITLANMPLQTLVKAPAERNTEELKIGIHLKRPAEQASKSERGEERYYVQSTSKTPLQAGSIGLLTSGAKDIDGKLVRASVHSLASAQRLALASKIAPSEEATTSNASAKREERQRQSLEAIVSLERDFEVQEAGCRSEDDGEACRSRRLPSLRIKVEDPMEDELLPNDTEQRKKTLLATFSSTSTSAGARLKDMAMAFTRATSERFQAASQKVFGTDKKRKDGASPKGKRLKDATNKLKDREQKAHALARKGELDADQEKTLKDIFQAFDLDGTGAICYKHLAHISKKLQKGFTPEQLHATLNEADRDGDGEVNYREFVNYMTRYGFHSSGPLHMIRPEHCRPLSMEEMFMKLDEDHMGTICFKNLVQISRRAGKEFSQDEIRSVLGDADRDGDGEISFKEFQIFMEKVGLKAGTPLHIFANYMEADELARSLTAPMSPKLKKKEGDSMASRKTRNTGGKKLPNLWHDETLQSKKNRPETDDMRKPKPRKFHPGEEERAASDDEFVRRPSYEYEVERKRAKGKSRDSKWTPRSSALGVHSAQLPASPRLKAPSAPRDRSKKPWKHEKWSRHRQRDVNDDVSDLEDAGTASTATWQPTLSAPMHGSSCPGT